MSEGKGNMHKTITTKELEFVNEYLSNGKIGYKAYMAVYKRVTKEETAKAASSRKLSEQHIKDYIAELDRQASEESGITRLTQVQDYKKRIDSIDAHLNEVESLEAVDYARYTKLIFHAADKIARLLGLYAPEKVDITDTTTIEGEASDDFKKWKEDQNRKKIAMLKKKK